MAKVYISVAAAWLAGLMASQPRLLVASKHDFAQAIATLVASRSIAAASSSYLRLVVTSCG
jgi:hypothetical protein